MENPTLKASVLVGVVLVSLAGGFVVGKWIGSSTLVPDYAKFGECLRPYAGEIDGTDGQKLVVVTAPGIAACVETMSYKAQ